jgi:hypothetical protein
MTNPDPRIHVFRFGLRGWAAIGAAILILGAVTVLALGLFFFLLPVLLLAPVLYYFLPRPGMNPGKENPTVIDGEFRVVEARKVEGKRDAEDGNAG